MSIKSTVDELDRIEAEIKRNNTINCKLRKRVKVLKTNITDYLVEKNQLGMKYKGREIRVEPKDRRPPKKKADKREDGIAALKEEGVHNPEAVYDKLILSQKGDIINENKLKIKKIKEKK